MARYSKKLVNKSNFKNRSKNSTRNRKPKSRQTRAKKIIKKNKKTIRRKFKGGTSGFCELDNEKNVILDFSIQPTNINDLYTEILNVLKDQSKASNLLAGIYQSEFLFELFLIIEEEYINTPQDNDVNKVLIKSVNKLLGVNEKPYLTFIKSAVESYISKILKQTGGGSRDKPSYNKEDIISWGSEVIDHLKVVPLEEPSIDPPARPLRQPRSHRILTFTPPSGSHPPVTLNLHSKLPNLKNLRKKMKLGFKRRYINSMLIEGTPLHTIEEDPGEEDIRYAEDEHREIVVLENKIKDISLHILENIFKDISIDSAPSGDAGVDAHGVAGVDAEGDADDDANDVDGDRTKRPPPEPAPRPFNTFSFADKVKILGSRL